MSEEIRELIGHHGTSSKNARLIRENGFVMSTAGWLGKGIYFFHNDSDLASAWARKKFRNQRVEVITKNIRVEHNKIFDLVDVEGEHNKLFHKLRLDLLNRSKETGVRCSFNKEDFEEKIRKIETKVINSICERGKFDIVRAATFTKLCNINEWSVTPNGVEVCVKKDSYVNMG